MDLAVHRLTVVLPGTTGLEIANLLKTIRESYLGNVQDNLKLIEIENRHVYGAGLTDNVDNLEGQKTC